MPNILKNLLISVLFGFAVFLITMVTVWRSTGDSYYNNYAVKYKTTSDMRSLRTAIAMYQIEHGVPPPSLDIVANEIEEVTGFYRNSTEAKPGDLLVDSYGTPYQYSTTGTSYTLISLGQDRKAGGVGYNADDVYHDGESVDTKWLNDVDNDEVPPFSQYWSFKHTNRPLWFCIAAGISSFLLAFYSMQSGRYFAAGRQNSVWLTFGAILIAAIIMTSFLAWFHVPSTH